MSEVIHVSALRDRMHIAGEVALQRIHAAAVTGAWEHALWALRT